MDRGRPALVNHSSLYTIMHIRIAIVLVAGVLAGCATPTADTPVKQPAAEAPPPVPPVPRAERPQGPISTATTLDDYKRDLARRISQRNANRVFPGRPQALLRSVVVVRYAVDANGSLLRSEIMRSNRDRETEATALATLRSAVPFPRPAAHLVRKGRVEMSETWLFNNDGRFQLRTVALPQMDR
jgi:protein TonB